MYNNDETERRNALGRERMSQTGWSALVGGGLLLLFGLYYRNAGLVGISDSAVYNIFVDIMVWTLLVGGLLNLASAALLFLRWGWALAADAIVASATGAMLMLIGLVRLVHNIRNSSMDLQDILLLVFGAMFIRSGMGSWQGHASLAKDDPATPRSNAQPEMSVPVEGLKESARERLLQAKANLRQQLSDETAKAAIREQPDSEPPMMAAIPEVRRPTVAPPTAEQLPSPAVTPVEQPPTPAPPDAIEDGFLAELGRLDQNERK